MLTRNTIPENKMMTPEEAYSYISVLFQKSELNDTSFTALGLLKEGSDLIVSEFRIMQPNFHTKYAFFRQYRIIRVKKFFRKPGFGEIISRRNINIHMITGVDRILECLEIIDGKPIITNISHKSDLKKATDFIIKVTNFVQKLHEKGGN